MQGKTQEAISQLMLLAKTFTSAQPVSSGGRRGEHSEEDGGGEGDPSSYADPGDSHRSP